MKTLLQEALRTLENRVRNSLNRIDGVQVHFERIEKRGGFFTAVYTVNVPIFDEDDKDGAKNN